MQTNLIVNNLVLSNIENVRMRKLAGVWLFSLNVYKVINIEEGLGLLCIIDHHRVQQ